MSFVAAMILSSDCTDIQLVQLREIYGISLKEVCNQSIRCQIDDKQKFYIFNDDNGYFWNQWNPIGVGELFERAAHMQFKDCENKYSKIVDKWEVEFKLRYTLFEAQMYRIIIKYLKNACNIANVGIVGFMLNDSIDNFQFPTFNKKTVQINDLNPEVFYRMEENCIYYFE